MPNFEVWPTLVADRQLRDLRGETRKNAKKAMDRLERRGCEAADYHLEGDEVERLCVVNLGRDWRMIVAFPETDEVAVILVGRHIERRPQVDVYRRLYLSLGIEVPTMTQRPPAARRAMPAHAETEPPLR